MDAKHRKPMAVFDRSLRVGNRVQEVRPLGGLAVFDRSLRVGNRMLSLKETKSAAVFDRSLGGKNRELPRIPRHFTLTFLRNANWNPKFSTVP